MKAKTPNSILEHKEDYKKGIWRNYTLAELGWWVHLFVKRSAHRTAVEKKAKDLHDAQNYLNMMQAHIDAAKEM